jgi:putative ABC transport system substrate-binding protein
MRRRDFVKLIGGGAAAWPLAARAQQAAKLPTIGLLGVDARSWAAWATAFAEQLSQFGWIEGRSVTIEYRWSEGRPERVAEVVAEFVRQKVDIVVTYGGAVAAFKQATRDIPIVFALAGDPVGIGLVDSLSHPGGNVTGLSLEQADIAGKRLETLRDVVPNLHGLAVVANVGYPASAAELAAVLAAARGSGLEVTPYEIRCAEDIAAVVHAPKSQADALYVVEGALVLANINNCRARPQRSTAYDFRQSRYCSSWRSYFLRTKLREPISTRGRLCR